MFGARTPSYATVTELDKRVRAYYIPPSLQAPGFGNAPMYTIGSEPPSMRLTMQRYIILAIKEVSEYHSTFLVFKYAMITVNRFVRSQRYCICIEGSLRKP